MGALASKNTKYERCKYLRSDFVWDINREKSGLKPILSDEEFNRRLEEIAKNGTFRE